MTNGTIEAKVIIQEIEKIVHLEAVIVELKTKNIWIKGFQRCFGTSKYYDLKAFYASRKNCIKKSIVSILPAVILILMASSVRYTMTEGKILDTVLHGAITVAGDLPKWAIVLFIYLIVLVMNFFISSGSAKAFLLMPLIVPMAQVFGVSSQLCVLAFAFGDGFSNVFYPTNTVLLISLGMADVSYGKWVKYSWKFQLINLLLTSLLLMLGYAVGYC